MRAVVTGTLIMLAAALPQGLPAQQPYRAPQVMSAADLQQLCAGTDHVSHNVCRVYILGVAQGIALGLSRAEGARVRPCLPATASAESLESTLKQHLSGELPEAEARADAARYIEKVLVSTFPCARRPAAR